MNIEWGTSETTGWSEQEGRSVWKISQCWPVSFQYKHLTFLDSDDIDCQWKQWPFLIIFFCKQYVQLFKVEREEFWKKLLVLLESGQKASWVEQWTINLKCFMFPGLLWCIFRNLLQFLLLSFSVQAHYEYMATTGNVDLWKSDSIKIIISNEKDTVHRSIHSKLSGSLTFFSICTAKGRESVTVWTWNDTFHRLEPRSRDSRRHLPSRVSAGPQVKAVESSWGPSAEPTGKGRGGGREHF